VIEFFVCILTIFFIVFGNVKDRGPRPIENVILVCLCAFVIVFAFWISIGERKDE
jgi:hypothetical protein